MKEECANTLFLDKTSKAPQRPTSVNLQITEPHARALARGGFNFFLRVHLALFRFAFSPARFFGAAKYFYAAARCEATARKKVAFFEFLARNYMQRAERARKKDEFVWPTELRDYKRRAQSVNARASALPSVGASVWGKEKYKGVSKSDL